MNNRYQNYTSQLYNQRNYSGTLTNYQSQRSLSKQKATTAASSSGLPTHPSKMPHSSRNGKTPITSSMVSKVSNGSQNKIQKFDFRNYDQNDVEFEQLRIPRSKKD